MIYNQKLINIKLIISIAVSLLSIIYGLGRAYHVNLTPAANFNTFKNIHSDNWVGQGATVALPSLGYGNRAAFVWGEWLPAGIEPRVVKIQQCNKYDKVLAVPGQTTTINIEATCKPIQFILSFDNPYYASATDQRMVGAQLQSLKIDSILGVPILKVTYYVIAIVALCLLVVLLKYSITSIGLLTAIYGANTLNFFFILLVENQQYTNMFYAYGLVLLLLLGFSAFFKLASVASDSLKATPKLFILALILSIAAIIRMYGLDFGLPFIFHPDEFQKYKVLHQMQSFGDFNPRYFLHPSGLLYATYFMYLLSNANTGLEFVDLLIYSGRLVSCIAGVLSVYFTYKIARDLFTEKTGLWAAAILAVVPLHVTSSRYLKEDALLTFCVLLVVYFTLVAVRKDSLKYLAVAALFCGVSASIKYTGAVTALCLFAFPWFNFKLSKLNYARCLLFLSLFLLVPIGFIIITPYSILDSTKFIADFNYERSHMLVGHSSSITAQSQLWMFHLGRSIIPGQGWILTALAVSAMGIMLRVNFKLAAYLIGLVLLFYLPAEFVRAKPAPQPERYIVPCLPFLAIFSAYLINIKPVLLRSIVTILLSIGLVLTSYRTITLASEIPNDTRQQLAEWMLENIPAGSKVLVDWKPYGPQFNSAPFEVIYLDPEQVINNLNRLNAGRIAADYLVLSSLHYDRYFSMPNSPAAFRQVIRNVRYKHNLVVQFKAKHGSYGFHNPKLSLYEISIN